MAHVLITGCSSGYGLTTAKLFLDKGWTVVATMREIDKGLLPASDRLRILRLDVTDEESIDAAVTEAGPIDVLVNNAGIGAMGAFEGTSSNVVRELFETNTFGPMAMIRAVLPIFKATGYGVIINVSSSVVFSPVPLSSAYSASKAALEGFTKSLSFELADLGVVVKLIQPGYTPTTSILKNSARRNEGSIPEEYAAYANRVFEGFASHPLFTTEDDVAEAVYIAATDQSGKTCFPAGADALALADSL